MSTIEHQARQHAAEFIAREEGLHLHAYPDPRSPMGRALGARGIDEIGRGGKVPASVAHLSGDPWTIGLGATGVDVVPGAVWSRQHALDRFAQDLAKFHDKAERAWPGMRTLHPLAQAALISVAYNRGTAMQRDPTDPLDRRREMRDLRIAVIRRDYLQMAALIDSMKRIWTHERMGGLVRRREREAELCRRAARETNPGGVIA